jgi:hypothetical protein
MKTLTGHILVKYVYANQRHELKKLQCIELKKLQCMRLRFYTDRANEDQENMSNCFSLFP